MNNRTNNSFRKQNDTEQGREQQKNRPAPREVREGASHENSRDNQRNHYNRDPKDNSRQRYNRDNYHRQHSGYHNNYNKPAERVKAIETLEDIKADITRIEKEIQLEIKEIKSIRLGL